MTQLQTLLMQDVMSFHADSIRESDDAMQIDSCAPFERIAVRTRNSVYDVIVLSGDVGDVLVRGGRFFPEFRRAELAGATAGGSALKMRSINVGLRMEFHVAGESFVTSTVQGISGSLSKNVKKQQCGSAGDELRDGHSASST